LLKGFGSAKREQLGGFYRAEGGLEPNLIVAIGIPLNQEDASMKLVTIVLAGALALTSTFAVAQGAGGGGAGGGGAGGGGSAAGAAGSTTPGPGTTGSDPNAVKSEKMNQSGTTGTGSSMPSNSASTWGAPTAAGANSTGSRTQPGAVQSGTSH
jgi:hypothetical protein